MTEYTYASVRRGKQHVAAPASRSERYVARVRTLCGKVVQSPLMNTVEIGGRPTCDTCTVAHLEELGLVTV
jgi:hypothetical protein